MYFVPYNLDYVKMPWYIVEAIDNFYKRKGKTFYIKESIDYNLTRKEKN